MSADKDIKHDPFKIGLASSGSKGMKPLSAEDSVEKSSAEPSSSEPELSTIIHVGTGGWMDIKKTRWGLGATDPLKRYARIFRYVEVNNTFYSYPNERSVRSWRRRVPRDFFFTVKCNRDLTHKAQFKPSFGTQATLEYMLKVCKLLDAKVLVFQTAETMKLTPEKMQDIKEFFNSVQSEGVRLAWELRHSADQSLPGELLEVLKARRVIHVVDLSRNLPSITADIVYSRLFGPRSYMTEGFTDEEMATILQRAISLKPREIFLTFHSLRMYDDAYRFKMLLESRSVRRSLTELKQ